MAYNGWYAIKQNQIIINLKTVQETAFFFRENFNSITLTKITL